MFAPARVGDYEPDWSDALRRLSHLESVTRRQVKFTDDIAKFEAEADEVIDALHALAATEADPAALREVTDEFAGAADAVTTFVQSTAGLRQRNPVPARQFSSSYEALWLAMRKKLHALMDHIRESHSV